MVFLHHFIVIEWYLKKRGLLTIRPSTGRCLGPHGPAQTPPSQHLEHI
jgi:hypothetical protein